MAFTICRARIAPVMVEVEATYGTDPTPVAATDDLLTFNNSIVAQTGVETFAFNPHKNSFTKTLDIIGQRFVDVTVNTMLQGSGTAGAVANGTLALGALLKCCGVKETISANTNIIYQSQANMAALQSATLWTNHHGYIHKVNGMVGNFTMRGTARGGVEIAFRGQGKYAAPVAVSTSFDAWTGGNNYAGAFLSATCTINNGTSYTPVFDSFEFDHGTVINRVDDCNNATGMWGEIITDANPMLTMRIATDTDSGAATTYDEWYTDLFASTTHLIGFKVGSGTGRVCTFSYPTAQLIGVTQEEKNGHRLFVLRYKVQHTTPGSEWTITVT